MYIDSHHNSSLVDFLSGYSVCEFVYSSRLSVPQIHFHHYLIDFLILRRILIHSPLGVYVFVYQHFHQKKRITRYYSLIMILLIS